MSVWLLSPDCLGITFNQVVEASVLIAQIHRHSILKLLALHKLIFLLSLLRYEQIVLRLTMLYSLPVSLQYI